MNQWTYAQGILMITNKITFKWNATCVGMYWDVFATAHDTKESSLPHPATLSFICAYAPKLYVITSAIITAPHSQDSAKWVALHALEQPKAQQVRLATIEL